MKSENSDTDKEGELNTSKSNKDAVNVLMDKATDSYKWWDNLATFNEEDSIGMTIFKISIRAVGVIVMLLLSPVALVAIIIAFMAVL